MAQPDMIPAARKKRYNSGAGRGWWKAARLSAAKRDWSFRIVSVKSAVIAALAAFGLSAPSAAWAALSPDATTVAQTRPPVEISSYPSGDASRPATLGHIRWLAERSDRQWEENQRRWDENQRRWDENWRQLRETRKELAELKDTVILVLGMIIAALLYITGVQLLTPSTPSTPSTRAGAPAAARVTRTLQRPRSSLSGGKWADAGASESCVPPLERRHE